jgi:hypothetical protein
MTKRSRTTRKKTYTPGTVSPIAGEAIAAGGYGCVFKPQLKCQKYPPGRSHDPEGVSKLMIARYADEELAEIGRVKPYVDKVPNKNRYFIIDDIWACSPGDLTTADKHHFNSKCGNLTDKGITAGNVNDYRNSLKALNIPYGGVDLSVFWTAWLKKNKSVAKMKEFAYTNAALVELLQKGIVPLNQQGYLHLDLKGQNILQKGSISTGIQTRVIDWGLSSSFGKHVPDSLEGRPLMFNAPFSSILFNDYVPALINKYSKLVGASKSFSSRAGGIGRYQLMQGLAANIYDATLGLVGSGHNGYILMITNQLYDPLLIAMSPTQKALYSRNLFGRDIIIAYLAEVLMQYLPSLEGSCSSMACRAALTRYFLEVFSKNVDVWGFLMGYVDLVTESGNPWTKDLQNSIARILTEYCFSPTYAAKPIPIDKLCKDLLALNVVIGQPMTRPVAHIVAKKLTKAEKIAAMMLQPCPEGQERNPVSGRCKKIPKKKQTKKIKLRLTTKSRNSARAAVVVKKQGSRSKPRSPLLAPRPFSHPTGKRCPKGSTRKKDGKCHPK